MTEETLSKVEQLLRTSDPMSVRIIIEEVVRTERVKALREVFDRIAAEDADDHLIVLQEMIDEEEMA